jgi:hypothetical protein
MIRTFEEIKLKVLVFGPSPGLRHQPGFAADLLSKRRDIRDALKTDGHDACFPEDLMTGSVDPAIDNTYIWEQMLVRKYDMVVNLVGSFGAVSELSLFMKKSFAQKAALFFNKEHVGGVHYQQARVIEAFGANLHTYIYPIDLTSCNLMKQVREKVWAVRVCKFYAS